MKPVHHHTVEGHSAGHPPVDTDFQNFVWSPNTWNKEKIMSLFMKDFVKQHVLQMTDFGSVQNYMF